MKQKQLQKFICPFKDCQKSYTLKNIFLAHLRTHYGIKPFICQYCGKSFNEKGNLKTHTRIHTGERPFKCHKCQKGFKALGQLKDHFISHTGFKPFQCPHCKKFYRRKEILKNHIIIHEKEPFFLNNKEKYNEMIEKVKEMKHINYDYDDLDCGIKNKRKTALFQTKTNIDKKRENSKTFFILEKNNNRKKNNEVGFIDNKYFSTIKNFLIDDNFFEDDYCNGWQNELNNILPSTDEFSVKEENHIKSDTDKINIKNNNYSFEPDNNQNDLTFKFITSNLNCINFNDDKLENDNKEENEKEDCCSKMTNLYNEFYESNMINDFLNIP